MGRRARGDVLGHPRSIRMPDDLDRALVEEAAAQRRPFTFVVIEILRDWQAKRRGGES